MAEPSVDVEIVPGEPDIDQDGVDRAQIRRMLDLTPVERLRFIESFVASIAEIHRLNGTSWIR